MILQVVPCAEAASRGCVFQGDHCFTLANSLSHEHEDQQQRMQE